MTKNFIGTFAATLIVGLVTLTAVSGAAQADDRKHYTYNRGHSVGHSHGYFHGYNYGRGDARGYDRDRVVYYTPSYVPPRQVVYYRPFEAAPIYRTYRVGEFLPAHVRCVTPSRSVLGVLPPERHGTRYVQVDNNVYLISAATDRILDAMVLLSGVR